MPGSGAARDGVDRCSGADSAMHARVGDTRTPPVLHMACEARCAPRPVASNAAARPSTPSLPPQPRAAVVVDEPRGPPAVVRRGDDGPRVRLHGPTGHPARLLLI